MILIREKIWDERGVECPYLPDRRFQQEFFQAQLMDSQEFGGYLEEGWRRFGSYFFRPKCSGCQACRPIRVLAGELLPSKSQRRVLRKNEKTRVVPGPLDPRPQVFEIYQNHSRVRFGRTVTSLEGFLESYFVPGAPGLQVEYFIQDRLAGVGFCDVGERGLSSVYYVFHEDFEDYNLGTFSVFAESRIALELGKEHYYMGYYIQENQSMRYKGAFYPREIYDWEAGVWNREERGKPQ